MRISLELICRMYKHTNYILVNSYTKKAFWSNVNRNSYTSLYLKHILDTLQFIVTNIYIWFGHQLFISGIPMDGNADLYLSYLEYKFHNKLNKNKNFNLVQKLKYINDLLAINVENFM